MHGAKLRVVVFLVLVLAVTTGCLESPEVIETKVKGDMARIKNAIYTFEVTRPDTPIVDQSTLVGMYLPKLLKDPWGVPYVIDAKKRVVTCYGKDGKPGGEGANKDFVESFTKVNPNR